MALDREAYFSYVDDLNRKAEEQAAREAEEARPFSEKAWNAAAGAFDAAAGALDAAGGVLGEVGEGFVSSAARARDAYGRFLDARRASDEPRHVFLSRPDVQEAVDDLESAAVDFVMAPVKVFADHTLAPARSYVAGRIDAAADAGTEVAQDLRATETFVSYFMTPEDKLRKAREIEEDTGIPADAFMDDAALYKEALRIHDYTLRKKALMQDEFSMEAVFEEFPEIRAVAGMSPKDAALALHDIESVRQTHGIVESFTHFLEVGNRKLEYDNLQYKMATGTADENDRQRAADLEKLSDSDKKRLPSFFDDPLAMAAGGLASSAPEMVESLREGLRDGLLMAEAAAIAGAAAGTAIEPVGGTLAGGALGAGGGFVAGFARSVLGSAARRQMVRTAMTRGMQAGMFEGMRRPETGARYAEYGKMKDKEGNPLLSEDERRLYAAVGGAANAAIEMWNAGLFAKPLRGLNLFGREGGYGADAIRAVIDRAKYDAASRESVAFFAKEQVKDVLKIAVTESLEEGAQSLSDDLIHNEIVDAADGRAADEAVSPGDMAVRALLRTAEAFPVGVGFGLAAPLGSAGAALRHARRLSSAQAREEVQVQHTLTGTVMLEGLQQVSSSAKLKQTAPDVQQEIIRAQVQGSPFEAAYVDTVAALQSPEGAKDLEAVARAAGISDEELSLTIAREGLLYVPVEKYAQSAASPALLEAVSFSPEADSIARMKMNARALTDAMEQAQKEAVKARTQAVHAIVNAWFPEAPVHADEKEKLRRDADREMAVAAITQDPDSPAHGWRVLYDVFTAERDALLHPALDALARGMKKGVDILQNGADGRGIRVSNNAPWYQEYYKENGKAPNQEQLRDLAYLLTVGDVSAPKVEGWMPSSQEAADAMEAARGQLDELNAHIGTLSNIKDRMMQLDAAEVRATQGLTPEAYGVYHAVMAKLREIGGVQAQAARLNALLFAARADAVARVMREKGGKPDYTARDYFDGFVLRDGGRYIADEEALHQTAGQSAEARLARDESNWNALIDRYDAADKKKWKAKKDGKLFRVMDVPLVMQLLNIPYDSLHVFGSFFTHSVNPEHKGMTLDLLRQVPRQMTDPLMIVRGNKPDSYVFVVDLKDTNGATIVVPVEINKRGNSSKAIANVIDTAFGKTVSETDDRPSLRWFRQRANRGDVLYINKKKSIAWLRANGNSSPAESANSNALSKFIVSGVGQNVKTEVDLKLAAEANPGFYQNAPTVPFDDGRGKVVDIKFIDVDEKRALKSPHIGIRFADEEYKMGDDVENSHNWVDGNWTEEELNGASAVNVAEAWSYDDLNELKETAIERLNEAARYPYDHAYLVAGTSNDYGEDVNESVIRNAEVIGILKLVRESEAETFYQRAWVGSGADFDAFDLGYVGTGEGAQVHGYGLYAAKDRAVSKEYKKRIAQENKWVVVYDGKEMPDLSGDVLAAIKTLKRHTLRPADEMGAYLGELIQKLEEELDVWKDSGHADVAAQVQEEVRLLKLLDPDKIRARKGDGKLYEVEIPDDDVLLDEQKCLADQSEDVRASLDMIMAASDGVKILEALDYGTLNKEYDEALREFRRIGSVVSAPQAYGKGARFARGFLREEGFSEEAIAELKNDPIKAIAQTQRLSEKYHKRKWALKQKIESFAQDYFKDENAVKQTTGRDFYLALAKVYQSEKAASLELHRWGVEGITYDGQRDGRCFVVFDDKAISIIQKFNQEMQDAVSSEMAAVRKRYEGTPQWMMAPNGKPTNLTEEEWLAVRTPAFKAAFGDWEQVAQRQRYLNTAPIEVAEKQIVKSEGVTVMEAAFRWAAAHLPVQVVTPFGTVEINRASVKDSLGHGFSQKKLDAVTSLPEGMKVAAFIGEEQDFGGADINNGYFCYPIMYQGEKQVVFVRARRDVNSNKLYVHEVWTEDEIKDIPLQTAAKFLNSKPHGGNVLYKSILAEFLHGDKGVSPNLLDENGEPLPSVLSSRHNQEQQRAIYGEFSKENGKKIITLFAGANPSTMLHEMGHLFLDDLDELAQFDEASAKDLATVNEWAAWHEGAAKEYENTPWAEEFRAHEAAIRDALKSGDAIALRAARNRWRHERFARGFELYLYEGKAPSKALRGVFRRFKQLLRRIYQFVKDVGGKPSPEVEAVMARMIASEEEIKAAELDERWRPVEKMGGKEALDDLLGDDVADTYAKWLEEARRDAEDILRARVMKDLKKEARKEFKARVEEERERKRVQLENEPVYLAEAAIRAQGDERAALLFFPSVEAYKEERAKRKSPEEELQDAMEVFAKGLDEELMTAALSDENVARAMQTPEAYHRRVAIEREALRAKERLARYVGGAPKEEAAAPAQEERTGKEAEGTQESRTGKEEKARADKEGARRAEEKEQRRKEKESRRTQEERRRAYEEAAFQNARYLRAEARRLLAESPISESCNPEFFRRKERSHARAAARAAARGRWDEALSAKDAQALAAACAYEAAKNASKVDALRKDVQKKLGARTVRLAPNERYWLHHIAYLLGLKSSDAEKPVDGKSLSALFDEYRENNDVDAADPTDLLELITQEKRSYTAMRLGDFADVVDALRILYTVGRDRNRMKSVAGKTVEEVCDEMMADSAALRPEGVVEHPVSEDTGGLGYSELLAKVPGIGEVIARLTQKGALPLLKPEIMIRLLGEKAHGYLYGTYERAQMRESELIGEKSEALDEIFSVYSRKERMGWKERNIDAHGDMLSKENVLCLALNWGTESNRKRVMDDIGQRMDVPRTLREHMTERDWKVVQEVWDLIDTFWEESARTEEELNGAHLGKVPAAAFTIETADGAEVKLRGGYYPIRYNPKKSARVNDKDVEAQAKNRMTGAQVFGTKRSHTKARSEGDVVLPVRLEFAVLQEHLYNAAHNIAFRIAARDVYRVMNNKAFEQYVCARYGRPVYDYLKQWTVDVWAIPADGSDAAMDALSRAMAAFRRNSTMAIMGWRMWPVLENVSNIGPVMDRLGAREALRAVLAFVRSPRALIRRARKSIFMADRMNNMERDLRRDPHIFDPTFSVLEFLRDNAYRPLVFTDLMLSIPTWNSAYERAFPEAMAEIRRENEENRRTYEAAQEDVNRLRAEVYDLRQESAALRDEMEKRKAPVPAAMQGSRYAGLSDAELDAEEERVREAFAAKEKEFYEAGLRLERAGELPILDEKERIKEAELRAVQAGDAAVRDTFGSGQTKDLSAIQRSRSELTKMFTSFYSFFNTQFNALAESYFKGKYAADGWAHVRVWMPLARSVLCRMVLVMIIGAIGKAVLGLDGDGERDRYRMVKDPKSGKMVREEVPWEERFMKVLGRNVLSTATGLIPVVRDLSGFVSARIFDGQTSGRNFELGSVAARGLNQVEATVDLMIKMGRQELEREEKEEAERARLRKMSPKERRRYEEDKRYRKPKKEVGVLDVLRSGAQAVSTFTAARTGVTNTLSDGLFSLLQYAEDMMESDNYYDPDVRNVLRAVFFDKKLRPKEVPPKTEKPKRGKGAPGRG